METIGLPIIRRVVTSIPFDRFDIETFWGYLKLYSDNYFPNKRESELCRFANIDLEALSTAQLSDAIITAFLGKDTFENALNKQREQFEAKLNKKLVKQKINYE